MKAEEKAKQLIDIFSKEYDPHLKRTFERHPNIDACLYVCYKMLNVSDNKEYWEKVKELIKSNQ